MEIGLPIDLVIKLLLGVLLGGLIGAERELLSKSAGFRTIILICLGATIFTICSYMMGAAGDNTRIASNVVVGIGFVGAGVIFKGDTGVNGITTAATIWVTAGIGMLIGAGFYLLACIATGIVVMVLFLFTFLERLMDRVHRVRVYRIQYTHQAFGERHVKDRLEDFRLKLQEEHYKKKDATIYGTWRVRGKEKDHQRFIRQMLEDPELKYFEY